MLLLRTFHMPVQARIRFVRDLPLPRTWSGILALALAAASAGAAVAVTFTPDPVRPQVTAGVDGRQVKLYDQLRVGLKAATKEDLVFITQVVALVDAGTLPRELVDSTFLWARNRYKTRPGTNRLRPIVYFRPALVERAKKIGVTI